MCVFFVASPCGNICQANEESNVSGTHIEETAIALMFVLVNLMKTFHEKMFQGFAVRHYSLARVCSSFKCAMVWDNHIEGFSLASFTSAQFC